LRENRYLEQIDKLVNIVKACYPGKGDWTPDENLNAIIVIPCGMRKKKCKIISK